jgi:hypothetical protein
MMGTVKDDPKKDVCHSTLVIEILMYNFFLNTTQQIPLQEVPIGVHNASTSGVNTSRLRECLQQTKQCLSSSNRLPRQMRAKE